MLPLRIAGLLGAAVFLVACDRNANEGDKGINATGAARDAYVVEKSSAPDKLAENTGTDIRDRKNLTLTPADQSEKETDRDLTRVIRRALGTNDQLSFDAKNIKIISVAGAVTLRGPVKSEAEKQTIEKIATQSGASSVDNQLEPTARENQ